MLYKYNLIFQFYASNSTCFYNLHTNKNLAWDLKVCIVLIQKSLNYLKPCVAFPASFMHYHLCTPVFTSPRYILYPLKALLFLTIIFSVISYCNSNESSLIFIVLDLHAKNSSGEYWCSVYAIQGFCATKQHEEDMKTFIHEKAKSMLSIS